MFYIYLYFYTRILQLETDAVSTAETWTQVSREVNSQNK